MLAIEVANSSLPVIMYDIINVSAVAMTRHVNVL
jgi:hypothetical protein